MRTAHPVAAFQLIAFACNEIIGHGFGCRELRIGSPATGGNYYPRPARIKELLRALERDDVAFLGPRRTGETSCLEQIKAQPGTFVPALLDLEKHDQPPPVVEGILATPGTRGGQQILFIPSGGDLTDSGRGGRRRCSRRA